jgi:hypothetical protein
MPNRNLTAAELRELFAPTLRRRRAKLDAASVGDDQLLWAPRRKLSRELSYLDRGKPMERTASNARCESSSTGSAPSEVGRCPSKALSSIG